ncbi:cytochrome P450 [Rhypophila decipiens]|uniref:Cytochrome P450 n=1 Tax=Rhypophila decipiens TaxID=261697 RepID=A0AAN6Y2S6_9PEZI|nr:cytochrome P450 [Rhypophila decipiens]
METTTAANSSDNGRPLLLGYTISGALAILALISLGLYSIITTLKQYLRLRHIPGPPLAPFTRLWLARSETGGRLYKDVYEVNQKYGPIARIGPNELVTDDPYLIRHMTNVRSEYRRSEWYYGMRFDPTKDNVLSTRDEVAHNKLRAKMAAGYSGKEVDNLEPIIDRNLLSLISLLEERYIAKKKPFDFARKAQFFTLDAISDLSYGRPFGYLANDEDMFSYIGMTEAQLPTIMLTSVYPILVDLLSSPLLNRLVPSDKDLLGLGRITGIVKKIVAERFEPNPNLDKKTRRDMLASFIAHGLTQDEAESEVIMQIMAGSDTTATAIRATMLHVITNPRILGKIHGELAQNEYTATSPPRDRIISSEESARRLPYMQAVIKEGLRIHPPVPALTSKVVPPGGDTWGGVYLPAGTKVGCAGLGVMRNPRIWGDNAAEFRPERWIEVVERGDKDKLREMEATLDLAFSSGRWLCLGRNVAFMELNKIFVELLRRFDFVVMDPTNPWKSTHAGIFTQSDFWLKGYKRA